MKAAHSLRLLCLARFRVFVLSLMIFATLTGMPALARTFLVIRTDDSTSVTSLRGAILEANRRGGYNVIVLTAANYRLTIQGIDDDAGLTGDLDVTQGTLMIVSSSGNAVIDAAD